MKTYEKIASAIGAIDNCLKAGNDDARHAWEDVLAQIEDELPSGSGFDSGTTINRGKSTADKIVLNSAFHHMDANGFYCGWSEMTVTIRASLRFGIECKINFHGNKRASSDADYFYQVFADAMHTETKAEYSRAIAA